MQDVSLSKGGDHKQPAAKKQPPKQSKTAGQGGNASLRKSVNITEEALAIGKVPPEDIARLIARG
jgi:hypothetical protein